MQVEKMGAFSWKDDVLNFVKRSMKGLKESKTINMRVVDNMYREYIALMAKGYKPASPVQRNGTAVKWTPMSYRLATIISNKLNVSVLLVLNFFLALYDLSSRGIIPFEKWNPEGYKKSKKLMKTFPSEKSILEKTGKTVKGAFANLLPLLVGAGIITGMVLYNKSK